MKAEGAGRGTPGGPPPSLSQTRPWEKGEGRQGHEASSSPTSEGYQLSPSWGSSFPEDRTSWFFGPQLSKPSYPRTLLSRGGRPRAWWGKPGVVAGGPRWGMVQAGWALPLLQLPQLLWEGGLAGHQPPPVPRGLPCWPQPAPLLTLHWLCREPSPTCPGLWLRPTCAVGHTPPGHTQRPCPRGSEVPGRPCSSLPVWSRSSRLSAQPRPEQFSPPGCPLLARGLCGRCRAVASLPGAGRPRHLHGHAQGSVAWRLGLGEGTGEVGGRLVSPSPGREPWLWSGGSR